MNKIIILIVTFFSINIYSQEIETENWITDLNFLKTELPKKHKNLFFKISKIFKLAKIPTIAKPLCLLHNSNIQKFI